MTMLAGVSAAQRSVTAEQSPRQAIIEMLSGGEAQFKKHLTVEMQSKLQNLMKGSLDNAPNPLQLLTGSRYPENNKLQSFDIGPVLFAFSGPVANERYEVQVDSDEPRGEEETMGLSLHLVRNGAEREIPMGMRFVVNLKRQMGIWRLNTVTVIASLPVGDPRMLDQSWWAPMVAATGADDAGMTPIVVEDRPKMAPLRAVRMISMAENIYAQKHPGIGFTCALSDLVNVGKGMDEDGIYTFLDADFADGLYNGYRFTLTGCERKPARMFRVIAEPLAGHGRAYCSDNLNNLRAAEDGRGATCLVAGKLARK
jgi:hypothetical protein